MKGICQLVLSLFGWQVVGELPNSPKYVLIAGPHTSNWDLIVGILGRCVKKADVRFLAKKEIFFFPLGYIIRWLGGTPVDRKKKMNTVEQITELFQTSDALILGLAPEGTRSPVDRWRSGFYHIAVSAKVPIVMVGFDYDKKEIQVQPPLNPSGDLHADYQLIRNYYLTVKGKKNKIIPEFID